MSTSRLVPGGIILIRIIEILISIYTINKYVGIPIRYNRIYKNILQSKNVYLLSTYGNRAASSSIEITDIYLGLILVLYNNVVIVLLM